MVRLRNRPILWICRRKVFRNKDLYVKYSGIRSYALDFALIARALCVVAARRLPGGDACVSSLYLFSKNQTGFQRTKPRFKEPIALGAWFALFLWLGFSGG